MGGEPRQGAGSPPARRRARPRRDPNPAPVQGRHGPCSGPRGPNRAGAQLLQAPRHRLTDGHRLGRPFPARRRRDIKVPSGRYAGRCAKRHLSLPRLHRFSDRPRAGPGTIAGSKSPPRPRPPRPTPASRPAASTGGAGAWPAVVADGLDRPSGSEAFPPGPAWVSSNRRPASRAQRQQFARRYSSARRRAGQSVSASAAGRRPGTRRPPPQSRPETGIFSAQRWRKSASTWRRDDRGWQRHPRPGARLQPRAEIRPITRAFDARHHSLPGRLLGFPGGHCSIVLLAVRSGPLRSARARGRQASPSGCIPTDRPGAPAAQFPGPVHRRRTQEGEKREKRRKRREKTPRIFSDHSPRRQRPLRAMSGIEYPAPEDQAHRGSGVKQGPAHYPGEAVPDSAVG